MRGKRNEPAQIMQTARAVAAARGETLEQVLTATTANACRLFGVPAGARAVRSMTLVTPATLYGPVAEDMILVEDLLESTKEVDLAPLRRMLRPRARSARQAPPAGPGACSPGHSATTT